MKTRKKQNKQRRVDRRILTQRREANDWSGQQTRTQHCGSVSWPPLSHIHTHNTRYLLARARAQGQTTNRREWTCWLRQLETAQQTLFFRQQHHRWIISGKKSKGISFYTTRRRSYHRYLLECIHLIVWLDLFRNDYYSIYTIIRMRIRMNIGE